MYIIFYIDPEKKFNTMEKSKQTPEYQEEQNLLKLQISLLERRKVLLERREKLRKWKQDCISNSSKYIKCHICDNIVPKLQGLKYNLGRVSSTNSIDVCSKECKRKAWDKTIVTNTK